MFKLDKTYLDNKLIIDWFLNDIKVGFISFVYKNELNSYDIIMYSLSSNEYKGIGYELIKESIKNILLEDKGVSSNKSFRNNISNRIWEKLKIDFKVDTIDTTDIIKPINNVYCN